MAPSSDKKVLIVCYSFPPYPGIGGRRWAKFAKYFAREEIQCHVINAFNYTKINSLWCSDVESPDITIHPLKFRFQYWIGIYSNKLLYRFISKLLRTLICLTKYSPYFATSLSRRTLQKKCHDIVTRHNINTIIVSGDPYMHYYITELKKKCNVNVILDYRDLWNDFSYYNQNKSHKLTLKQRAFFEFCEKESLKNCDEVVCVYEPMVGLLSARSGGNKEHFHLIPNGFDKDDYLDIKSPDFQNKIIRLYYGGNIYGERAEYFIRFLKYYSLLQTSDKQLWEQFCIVIDGDSPAFFDEAVKKLNDPHIIFEKGFLTGNQYIQKLNTSNFGILPIHNDYADNCFSTKVYDYLYLEKPIIHIGKRGKVCEFIENNKIGFAFNPDEKAELFFNKLLALPPGFRYPEDVHEKVEKEYDIKNLSQKYLELLYKKQG